MSPSAVALVVTILALVIGALIIFMRRPRSLDDSSGEIRQSGSTSKKYSDTVAIVGPVGSGKTVLLYQVR